MLFNKTKKKKANKIRKITSDSIPIISVDNSGIFEVDTNIYSMTIRLKDVNYSLSRQEDQEGIFLLFAKLLNYFTSDNSIQITINNENVQIGSVKDTVEMDCNKNDGSDEYRKEFNDMLLSNVLEGKNSLRKSIYITVTTECKNMTEAKSKLNKVMAEVSANLKRIGSSNTVLLLEERAELLHDFFRNGHEGEFEYDKNSDIPITNLIAPSGLEFRNDYFKMGDKYCRGLFLANVPSFLSDKFTSEIMEFDENVMLSIHMQGQEVEKTMRMLNNKLTSLKTEEIKAQETAAKNRRFTFSLNPHLREAMEEVEEFKDMVLNKNQKVFFTSYILVHMADSKAKLEEDTKTLQSIAGKNLCKLRVLKYEQEEAFRSVLPLGINELRHIDKCLTTESATVLSLPFNSVEYFDNHGFYYGKNTLTGNMIMLDKQGLKNQNSFVLGSPGSGKSFTTKRELVNVYLTSDADIFVVDPEDEYGRLCKALGGEVIEISVNSNTHINPLDMEYDKEEDPLRNKCDFMLTICNKILGGKDGLTPIQRTILDRVCHKVFKNYIDHDYNKKYQPTLVDFLDILENEHENEAKDLAVGLEIYCRGSLDLFAHKTNVDIKNRFQVYNIQKLGNALKPLGLQICLETIWQKVVKNRELGKQTLVVCDEAHLLFGAGNEYSADYMQALYKRSRKYKAWITCISQNITSMLDDKVASSLIANSDFLQILNQSPQDKEALAQLLGISDLQLSYVSNANPGEGLLIIGQSNIVPFNDRFPKNLKLYRLMTTNPQEIKKFKEDDKKIEEKINSKKVILDKEKEGTIVEIPTANMGKEVLETVIKKDLEEEKLNKLKSEQDFKIRTITELELKIKEEENSKIKLEQEIKLIRESLEQLQVDQESKVKAIANVEEHLNVKQDFKLKLEQDKTDIEEKLNQLLSEQENISEEVEKAQFELNEVTIIEDKLNTVKKLKEKLNELNLLGEKVKNEQECKSKLEKDNQIINQELSQLKLEKKTILNTILEWEERLKNEQEYKSKLEKDNQIINQELNQLKLEKETILKDISEIEVAVKKIEKAKNKNSKRNKLVKRKNVVKEDSNRNIYCVEDDETYSIDEIIEKWGVKDKLIIDVCNRKVKKKKRHDGSMYNYIQETVKDRRDNSKKHIMWYEEYLNIEKKEA